MRALLTAALTVVACTCGAPTPVEARQEAASDHATLVVCGLPVPPPAVLPPDGSLPIVYALVPCFEKQGGVSTIDSATYLYYIHTRPSQPSQHVWVPFDQNVRRQLVADFRALWETRFLDDLSIETVDYVFANGVIGKVIRFDIVERERVRIVDYEGSTHLKTSEIDERLRDEHVALRTDAFFDAGEVQRCKEVIRGMLADAGFLDGTVEHRIVPVDGSSKLVHLTFVVNDGPKYVIEDVDFTGNQGFSDRTLRGEMKDIKERSLLSIVTGRGTYRRNKFEDDAERVTEYYRDHGYLRVHVDNPEVRVVRDDQHGRTRRIRLVIPVREGSRYRLGNVSVAGNSAVKSEALLTLFTLKKGDYYSEKRVRKGFERARDAYGSLGHFEFTGYPDYRFSDESDPDLPTGDAPAVPVVAETSTAGPVVNLTLRVQEGEQYFINRISFVGNTLTKDKVVRRELRVLEGGVLDMQALKYSIQRLDQLGYFQPLGQERKGADDPVKIDKIPEAKNKVDVTLHLKEQNRNSLMFGAGVSGTDGVFVNGSFSTANFLGQGETVQVSGLIAARSNNYQVAMTEPYVFDRPISAGATLYSRKIDYYTSATVVGYSEVRTGADITAGVPLGRFTRGYATYGYEVIDTEWLDGLGQQNTTTSTGVTFSPFFDQGRHIESRAGISTTYNTVDNPFMPRHGKRLTGNVDLAGGPLGGTVSYVQPMAEAVLYIPTSSHMALGLRGQGAWIQPYGVTEELPYYRRFFLGGETQIRGVDIRTVGPVDAQNRALGGTKYVLFNAEYYFDIIGSLRALLFHDAGQAFAEDSPINLRELRTSSGVELRFLMPVMNVPFRFIYAWNIYRDSFQPARALKFAVGTTF